MSIPEAAAVDMGAATGSVVSGRGAGRREAGAVSADPAHSAASALRAAGMLQAAASLLWIPQAALLSLSIANIVGGLSVASIVPNAVGILALGIARAVLDALGGRMAFRAARAELSRRRADAVAALASHSPIDALRPASGAAASVLAEQAEAIVPYLSRYQPVRLRLSIVPLAILACVSFYSWAAALILLVAAPLIPIFMALIGMRAKAASEAQLVELGGMNAFLLDRLRGMATIRSMGAVDATAVRLRDNAESLRARTMAVLRIAFLSSAVLELFAALGVAMVAVYVGFHLLGQLPFGAWGGGLTLGEGIFILLLAPAFFEPLRDLSAVWHDRAAGEAALGALDRLCGAEARPVPAVAARTAPASPEAPGVRVEDVGFRHAGADAPVFSGLDIDIAAGEHVALLAPSGGGKSTLIALLAGLAMPQDGRVLVGGRPMTPASADMLRRGIALIGQHPHVFPGSLVDNVRLGRGDIHPDAARQALRLAGLGPALAARGSAIIGENGVGLSGGEASRLALARIAARPDVGLILADEPTAHLDSATASAIADALLLLAKDKTLVVATHDPALAARMDRTIRLVQPRLEDAA